MYVWSSHTARVRINRVSKVANPARGQLNRENEYFPCPRPRLRIWSREAGSAVPSRVSLLISKPRLNLVLTYGIPPDFSGGVYLLCTNNTFVPLSYAIMVAVETRIAGAEQQTRLRTLRPGSIAWSSRMKGICPLPPPFAALVVEARGWFLSL